MGYMMTCLSFTVDCQDWTLDKHYHVKRKKLIFFLFAYAHNVSTRVQCNIADLNSVANNNKIWMIPKLSSICGYIPIIIVIIIMNTFFTFAVTYHTIIMNRLTNLLD